jgi:hypothetical protein
MKHLLTLIFLLVTLTGFSQNIGFKASPSVGGAALDRGGTFDYIIYGNGNSNATTRQLLFDVQYDLANFEIVSVDHTGTGGNGGILPQGSTISLSYYDYNGYSYIGNSANTTSNGTTNYQNANYAYNSNMSNSILRITLNWATTAAMPFNSYSDFIKIKFRLKQASTAYTFNPIKLNFVAGWKANGSFDNTFQENPLSTTVTMNQNFGKYLTANVDLNSNLYNLSTLKVSFRDTLSNVGRLFNITSAGAVDINQSLLAANRVYEVSLMHSIDKTYAIYNSAITLSDFSTAQSEFTSNGLAIGGQLGNVLKTGQSLYATDINRNGSIDGGDLPRLLAQVVGLDTLMTIPAGYAMGSDGYVNLPTWKAADAVTIGGQVEWAYINPGATTSTLYVDMREFPSGVLPNKIKSIQLFDLYTGPVEYSTQDASWAQYKVPSNFAKAIDGTSTYAGFIRVNNGSYNLRAEFEFDANPNRSWGAITTSNWNTITYPKTYFKTATLGTNAILDLKYLLWGDVNRSHSSQVLTTTNGQSTVQTNAVPSLVSNTSFTSDVKIKSMASTGPFINTQYAYNSIDVNLANVTVTSNNIEIPVAIDTKDNSVGGLQLEFRYDPTKIKFEEMASSLPNSWFVFASAKEGVVKFGALDQNNKTPIVGTSTPFKLKFSAINSGVDLLTSIKVSQTMDASDSQGNQLGISVNVSQIKLTGYNNF